MPTPATAAALFGALGAGGAAAMLGINRRNSAGATETDTSPHALGRRKTSMDQVNEDPSFSQHRMMGEYNWRRNYGASFAHNSHNKFPSRRASSGSEPRVV
ncbi:hypothetical protein BZG36_00304 [Bifiguratus adelaidae]|uniref:Uncharacterized protein n=1 Tax=Bifiguratus adelaidae TaxID=1938954 RepID=A0A261Y8A8_9FUNG|nr:hypothetical protein BZG36_00304 [Bifiguratus adelaidae]